MKRKTIEIVLRGFLFVSFFGTRAHREENLVVDIKTIEYLSLGTVDLIVAP